MSPVAPIGTVRLLAKARLDGDHGQQQRGRQGIFRSRFHDGFRDLVGLRARDAEFLREQRRHLLGLSRLGLPGQNHAQGKEENAKDSGA